MIARGLLLALCATLAGCSTTGPLVFSCRGLEGATGYAQQQQNSRYVRQIRGEPVGPAPDAQTALPPAPAEPAAGDLSPTVAQFPLTLEQALRASADEARKVEANAMPARPLRDGWSLPNTAPIPADLLLSGGGQWGAYGAGFLSQLHRQGFDKRYPFGTVTGISTGAFQALFVGAGADDDYDRLAAVYAPGTEADLVRRYPELLAVVTGEMAAIARLRAKLEDALCVRDLLDRAVRSGQPLDAQQAEAICPMIVHLAVAGGTTFPELKKPVLPRRVFIGVVRADDGAFLTANATRIATDLFAEDVAHLRLAPDRLRNAQQCLAGVVLASAAMPLFYQQVQISDPANGGKRRTYYDGGVRQSVFEAELALDRKRSEDKRPIFVVRNGPTALLTRQRRPGETTDRDVPGPDALVNAKANALDAAMRAEKIVVNQIEVQSIADLRLTNPQGPVYFTTADDFHAFRSDAHPNGCSRADRKAVFDRDFMLCLRELGIAKAKKATEQQLLLDAWTRLITANE
ncbi:patatin-like phospholipase family protein [Novosphingobium huizhouense]|uniref:patatin-like phospholipase family protein n=1 Tax=Novosphingobium huizhouense TaxID=2866625 RepID=UPI001CD8C086|nr:patatin-like phospholipase family protein [Novosphingobium huizhouense]